MSLKKSLLFFIFLLLLNGLLIGQTTSLSPKLGKTPFVLGLVDSVKSSGLSETRILNIYLPQGYSPDSAATYPVIYLLDGSAEEDFIHIVGLVQYYNFPWIDRVPKSIVVGIANINRRKDFTFSVPNLDFVTEFGFSKDGYPAYGNSEKFISFIEKELQPFIQKKYKTNSSKTIIGQSLAGLLSTEVLLKKPNLFDTYIIMSPSLWWGKEALLAKAPELLKQSRNTKMKIYLGVGDEGNTMVNDAKKLHQILKDNASPDTKIYFDYLPDENHATITHIAVYRAFKFLYPVK